MNPDPQATPDQQLADLRAQVLALTDELAHLTAVHQAMADTTADAVGAATRLRDEIARRDRIGSAAEAMVAAAEARATAAEQRLAELRGSLPFRLAMLPVRIVRAARARLRR